MRLGDVPGMESDEFAEFTLADESAFEDSINRLIEDAELAAYVVARASAWHPIPIYPLIAIRRPGDRRVIDKEVVERTLRLLGVEEDVIRPGSPTGGIVDSRLVRKRAKAPMRHTEEADELIARVVNSELREVLRDAAELAADEGVDRIDERHLLPACDRWPFPFNRFC